MISSTSLSYRSPWYDALVVIYQILGPSKKNEVHDYISAPVNAQNQTRPF